MPNKNTFEIAPIKALLEEEVDLNKYWIDPFANRNKIASVTNDLSMDYDTDYHLDALDFLKMFENSSVDGVLYDPPYSPRQVSECYNDVGYTVTWDTTKASFWGNHKREISRIVKIGGKVITFGWNSGGIGYKYGFEIERILLVPHGGWHNDTICTVEVKTHEGEFRKKKTEAMERKTEMSKMTQNDEMLISKLKELPVDYWDFREDDTKEFTHGLHNYPAMMVCPISRNIIRLVKEIQPVNALLDPFAGSGTVLVEGMLSGIGIVAGNDINPLALLLTKVKTTAIENEPLNKEADELLTRVKIRREALKESLDSVDSYVIETLGLDVAGKKGWGDEAPKYLQQFCYERGLMLQFRISKTLDIGFGLV
jgi:16S rRNA G966 N2-methylase RsmD